MACDCDDLRKILALLAGAAQHNDLAEWDAYGALFAEHAVMHVFGRDYVGREAIDAFTARRHLGKHLLSTPISEIDGDTATVVVDHAFYRYPDLVLFGVGVYQDDLVKLDGDWKFARREIVVHGHQTGRRPQTRDSRFGNPPLASTMWRPRLAFGRRVRRSVTGPT